MKKIFSEYKHGLVLLYMFVYFAWFFYLEQRTNVTFTSMYSRIDDYIPFIEIFVIPYILWFAYISVIVLYLMFISKEDFYKCCAFLFIGMTICLIIYTFWPNAQDLRVNPFPRDNVFTRLVNMFYTADTCTNVCPSIHVYNSIGAHIAIIHCDKLKNIRWVRISSFILMVLICLSTMFIKQHSFVDFVAGVALAGVMYVAVYKINYKKLFHIKK